MMSDPAAFRLSLTIDGPEVSWDTFVKAARSLSTLIRNVDVEASGGTASVIWVIENISKASPLAIELTAHASSPEVTPKNLKRTVTAVASGIRSIQRSSRRPPYFNDAALAAAKDLADLRPSKLALIRLRNGKASVEVTQRLSANVDELIGVKQSSLGTVEGKLEILNIHGKRPEFAIFESLTGNRVVCHFQPEQLDLVVGAFGHRIAASGEIFSTASGRRLSVAVEHIEVFPDEDKLPTFDDMIGLLG